MNSQFFCLLICASVVAFSVSCRRGEEAHYVDPISITVVAPVLDGAHETQMSSETKASLQNRQFESSGTSALPTESANAVQALGIARARARREALRLLAREIAAIPLNASDTTAAAIFSRDAEAARRFEDWLDTSAKIELTGNGTEGPITAKAQVSGSAFVDAWPAVAFATAGDPTAPPIPEGSDPATAAQAAAEQRALTEARRQIRERLLTLRIGGESLRSVIERDRTAEQSLNRMMGDVTVEKTEFTPEGNCEVTASFDRARALELFPNSDAALDESTDEPKK